MTRGARRASACWVVLFAVCAACVARNASAADDAECLECHGDPELKGTRDGKEISVFVDPKALAGSVHAGRSCVECHEDLDGADYPHEQDPKRVDCATCHDAEGRSHEVSRHGQAAAAGDPLAPRCATCHGRHDVLSPKDDASPTSFFQIPFLCGRCHHEGSAVSLTHEIPQDKILENYSEDIHGQGLFRAGLKVTAVCTSCHTSHEILPHDDPRSSIHLDNVAKTCTKCHALIERVHQKVVEGRIWEREPNKVPACVECHSTHRFRKEPQPTRIRNENCLLCHGKPDLAVVRDGRTVSLHVDGAAYGTSKHAQVACAQCHSEVEPSRDRPCEAIVSKVDCAVCHAEVVQQHAESTHGRLLAQGDADAPRCLDCHDQHATRGHEDPASPTYPRNVPVLCGRCHREGEKAAKRISAPVPEVESYIESIHGKGLLESGLLVTATCISCHTAHRILPPSDPTSSVHPDHVAGTCGRCHHGIEEQFKKSIHWPGNGTTDRPLPTCKDCHTSHTIRRTDREDFRFLMMDQCGRCHEEETETFFETAHGQKTRQGMSATAKCYDCHGTHDILPRSHPGSTLSRDRIVETCGKCHENAHEQFTGYLTHATHHDRERYPWLFWTFWAMTALLVGTLAFALLHTGAWLVRLLLSKEEWRAHKALAVGGTSPKRYRRFDRYQRMVHLLMMLSFFMLAITGMALKFAYMGWAQAVGRVLGGAATMGVLHRFAAVTLMGVFVAHVWMVLRHKSRTGKTWKQMLSGPDTLMFTRNDLKEFLASIRWFFGRGPRPRYGRYTYWEKFDYMAVFWGVAVIGSTGLMLWFPEIATRILPGWFLNVAQIVHSDEALLAVAFIFTIHFFNTHFRPDKFPMDKVIFTGRVTLEELKYDKPREYEEHVAAGDLEERLVDPFPSRVERGLKVFGFFALGLGLLLIGLIVYTMVFGYAPKTLR